MYTGSLYHMPLHVKNLSDRKADAHKKKKLMNENQFWPLNLHEELSFSTKL